MDVTEFPGQSRLVISRRALLHNVRLIRRQIQPGTRVCAMIKADAYGHGADLVVDALCNFELEGLQAPTVDMLGLGSFEEAFALAEMSLPVMVLRPVENVYIGPARMAIEQAILRGWVLTVGTGSGADDVARIALALGKRAAVHVMVDSGMTRCGCSIENLSELLMRIESHTSLRLASLGTHLATGDCQTDPFIGEQLSRFRAATDPIAAKRAGKLIRTAANSGGVFFAPTTHLDMVRPGISMYGIDPTCKPSMDRPLQPVAKWTAQIVSILCIKPGTTVGYGQTWRSTRETRIGLVPVGYADGYMRCLGNRASVMLHGKATPVVGRVSMDFITIDLHDHPTAQISDEVVLLDDDPLSAASIYALAEQADTIPYELFTRIGPRVKRVAFEQKSTANTEQTETIH